MADYPQIVEESAYEIGAADINIHSDEDVAPEGVVFTRNANQTWSYTNNNTTYTVELVTLKPNSSSEDDKVRWAITFMQDDVKYLKRVTPDASSYPFSTSPVYRQTSDIVVISGKDYYKETILDGLTVFMRIYREPGTEITDELYEISTKLRWYDVTDYTADPIAYKRPSDISPSEIVTIGINTTLTFMADYPQIIEDEDVTNYKSRILLLTKMAEDHDEPSGKTKNKTTVAAHYTLNYNVDSITDSGLFRLCKGCYNFDDTGKTSDGKDVEWLYVVKYNDNVIRQFYLTAVDGNTTLTTRIRYKNTWRKWRTPSWLLPKYELTKNVRAYKNMHYISFGDFDLTLPPAYKFLKGDCVRLDQYEGLGSISTSNRRCNICGYGDDEEKYCPYCGVFTSSEYKNKCNACSLHDTCNAVRYENVDQNCPEYGLIHREGENYCKDTFELFDESIDTHSVKYTDRFQSNLNCEGFTPTDYFSYDSFYCWKSSTDHSLTTTLNTDKDKFYWCIKDSTGKILFTSADDISTVKHPCDETTWIDESNSEHTISFTVSDITADKEMETCGTYIFEVCNDKISARSSQKDIEYYKHYNYWTLLRGSRSRSTRERLQAHIEDGFNTLKKDVSDHHTRSTYEVKTLNERIDTEVATLNTRIDNEVATLNSKIANLQSQIDFYHSVSWTQINEDNTTITEEDLHTVLDDAPSCKYLISSTGNTITFPSDDVTYIEGQTEPETAKELDKIINKSIQVTVLSSGACTFNNLPLTCKVAADQTATIQLVKYQTKSLTTTTNHYEWLFTLQKQS